MLVQGRKYRTLLPSLTDSLAIEEDLKCKLNKFAFDEVGRKPPLNTTTNIGDSTHFIHTSTSLATLASLAPPLLAPPLLAPPLLAPPHTQIDTCSSSQGSTSGSESLGSSPVPHRIRKRKDSHRSGGSNSSNSSSERRHVCRVCNKGFTTSGHLARHNRIHTGEKNHECPYEGCDQKFSRHDNCIQHYRTHLKRELRASEAVRSNGSVSSSAGGSVDGL